MQLEITHSTRYTYAAAVSLAHHLAHLQPLDDDSQRLLQFDCSITPEPALQPRGRDSYGNVCRHFSIAQPHERLNVTASSRVQLAPRFAALDAAAAPPWDALAARLRYVACAPFEPAVEFALPSPYVPRLAELRRYALPSFGRGRPVAAGAIELMQRLHADFRYVSASTQIDTPLAEAFAQRAGVCQDFAHIMLGALRMLGLAARYVSGYLLTQQPAGAPPVVGADASHAWVQVWCPGTPGVPTDGWLDLDPTNDVVPEQGHVRLAVGRDYGDVTPLRGVIRGGGGRHRLAVGVTTRLLVAAQPPVGA